MSSQRRSGKLITVEGIDGAGKTTLVKALACELDRAGKPVEVLREPGGVQLAERLREVVKDPALQVSPQAEALIYAAARAELVQQRLAPLLSEGRWVLLDRFVDSSLAYQGGGRGLGVQQIRTINEFATVGIKPDLTLYLKIEPQTGRDRQDDRGEAADRLELEDEQFFKQIADTYDELAAAEPNRFFVIDASQGPQQVLADSLAAVRHLN